MSAEHFFSSIKATADAYAHSAREASIALKRNWLIIPASCCAYALFLLTVQIFGRMGFAGGMIAGLVQIVLISVYYCWLYDSLDRDKITLQTIFRLEGGIFSAVINTAFILFIFKFITTSLIQGLGLDWIPIVMQFAIVVLLNALPEVVYYHRYDGMTAIAEAFKFTRDNWIEWFLPFVFLICPLTVAFGLPYILAQVSRMDEMVPASIVFISVVDGIVRLLGGVPFIEYGAIICGVAALNWFMLFRGFLFKELESGSRRQRIYRARQR